MIPLATDERNRLRDALRANAYGDMAILTDPRDTSFVGQVEAERIVDEEVVRAIKSVPTHY